MDYDCENESAAFVSSNCSVKAKIWNGEGRRCDACCGFELIGSSLCDVSVRGRCNLSVQFFVTRLSVLSVGIVNCSVKSKTWNREGIRCDDCYLRL